MITIYKSNKCNEHGLHLKTFCKRGGLLARLKTWEIATVELFKHGHKPSHSFLDHSRFAREHPLKNITVGPNTILYKKEKEMKIIDSLWQK